MSGPDGGPSRRARVALALASIYLVWGSTYLGIRIALETIPPFFMMSAQFLIAGVVLYAGARARGVPRPTVRQWGLAARIGALLILGGNGGVAWAEQRVASGVAALMIASEPFWIVLLDWLFGHRQKPAAGILTGLLTGFGGIVLLIAPWRSEGAMLVHPAGGAALLTASVCWAAGSILSRSAELPESLPLATAMEMLTGGAMLLALGFSCGEAHRFHWSALSARSAGALAYLIVFGTLIGFNAYIWLLKVTTAAVASTYAFVNPVVAVFLGWLAAGEPLTLQIGLSAAVIVSGVLIISCHPQSPKYPTL